MNEAKSAEMEDEAEYTQDDLKYNSCYNGLFHFIAYSMEICVFLTIFF